MSIRVWRIFGLVADSVRPPRARRMGTPARSRMLIWRENSSRSTVRTRSGIRRSRQAASPGIGVRAGNAAVAVAPPALAAMRSGVMPRASSTSAAASAVAASSSPLTWPPAACPV